jgi:hypothetical protein
MVGAILFCSCNESKEVDIQHQLTANISTADVVKGMKDGKNLDYFSIGDTYYSVSLAYLIYDAQGALVHKTTETLPDFFQQTSFSTKLSEGNYTLVAWVGMTDKNGSAHWQSENENSLATLQLKTANIPSPIGVLGVSKTGITVGKSEKTDIAIQTVGSLHILDFFYGNAGADVQSIYFFADRSNDYYQVDNATPVLDNFQWSDEYSVSSGYTGIYGAYFLLPVDQLTIQWGSFDGNEEIISSGRFTFKVEAGKHQFVETDIKTGVTTITPATRGNAGASAIMQNSRQVFDVGKMKTEPAESSAAKASALSERFTCPQGK